MQSLLFAIELNNYHFHKWDSTYFYHSQFGWFMAWTFPPGTHQLGLGYAMCGCIDQRGPLCAIDASEQGHLQQEVMQNASKSIEHGSQYSIY